MTRAETDRLLQRISHGDNAAFEELYVKTRRGVYAFLYTYVQRSADAEDLMQTVYLKVKTNISQYRHGTNGSAWILQIAKNLALNELKKSSRLQLSDEVIGTSDTFEYGTVSDAMRRTLSEEEQRIITLHVLWGYRHREIADMLGCPTGTVTSKYKRAIKKMKEALKED
ncbi:MAG: sigma-70 family RNA polymerase sigma factor [Clostridia bacterium]|nr:sigma-70 family RNA polymerase sigma factor [Clostridia bacterium]